MTMRFTAAFLSTAWVGIVHWLSSVESWSHKTSPQATRHEFLQKAAGMVATGTSLLVASAPASVAASSNDGSMKLTNLSNADIEKIVVSDLEDRHFLVTGDLTRSIYDESATFTDEIDTYAMDQWMKGTAKLFVGKGSKLDIIWKR